MAKLHLDIAEGDTVRIGGALVTMERKGGKKARFMIEADRNINVELIKNSSKSDENNLNTRMSATDQVNTHVKNNSRA